MEKFNEFDIKKEMSDCVCVFKKNINRYIGNINTEIISRLLVDYYGNKVFLYKLSRITIENFNSLRISLFDASIKNNVKKSIFLSKLDLNITDSGKDLIVYLPLLTEERKKKILKLLKNDMELAKILIRNIRRKFKNKFKLFVKNGSFSKDEEKNINIKLQKNTDFYIKEIKNIFLNRKKQLFLN